MALSEKELTVGPYMALSEKELTVGPYMALSEQELTVGPYMALSEKELTVGPYMALSEKELLLRQCHVRTYYFGLTTALHTTQAHIHLLSQQLPMQQTNS
jgi:hypothetical protein